MCLNLVTKPNDFHSHHLHFPLEFPQSLLLCIDEVEWLPLPPHPVVRPLAPYGKIGKLPDLAVVRWRSKEEDVLYSDVPCVAEWVWFLVILNSWDKIEEVELRSSVYKWTVTSSPKLSPSVPASSTRLYSSSVLYFSRAIFFHQHFKKCVMRN